MSEPSTLEHTELFESLNHYRACEHSHHNTRRAPRSAGPHAEGGEQFVETKPCPHCGVASWWTGVAVLCGVYCEWLSHLDFDLCPNCKRPVTIHDLLRFIGPANGK